MRFSEKYRPAALREIVGQPCVSILQGIAARPYPCCVLLEGPPGVGKTAAAYALAGELGTEDEFSGLLTVPASELDIEECRRLFTERLRLRPMQGNGWHVLVLEELDGVGSKQVERYLKVKLETMLPAKCIVVATSNGTDRIDAALMQRFGVSLCFTGGAEFGRACQGRIAEIWEIESGGRDLPIGWQSWGLSGKQFSMRTALDLMQVQLLLLARQELFTPALAVA